MVVEKHDGYVGGLEAVFELPQPLEGTAAAVTEQQTLFLGELPRGVRPGLVRHLLEVVDEAKINVGRKDVLPDALRDVRVDFVLVEFPSLVVFLEHRAVGVDAPNLNVRVLLLEVLGRAADRSARAHTDNEVGDFTLRLLPNLRPSSPVVRLAVGEVVVLVAPHAVGDLVVQLLGHAVVAVWMVGGHGRRTNMHLRPHRAQHVHLLLALLAIGGANELVALDNAREREAHARVAGRALNDRASGLELTARLGRFNHGQRHAVLDTVAGVEILHLGPNRTRKILRNRVQPNHGRVANRSQNVFVHVHASKSSDPPVPHHG